MVTSADLIFILLAVELYGLRVQNCTLFLINFIVHFCVDNQLIVVLLLHTFCARVQFCLNEIVLK